MKTDNTGEMLTQLRATIVLLEQSIGKAAGDLKKVHGWITGRDADDKIGAGELPRIDEAVTDIVSIRKNLGVRYAVAVMGQFKSGKSTLINSLAGREVAPTSVTFSRTGVCLYRHAETERGKLVFRDGESRTGTADEIFREIQDHVSNDVWSKSVELVDLQVPFALLQDAELWDTPGFGVDRDVDDSVERFMREVDVVLWVFRADLLGGDQVQKELAEVRRFGKPVIGVLNFADQLAQDEVEEAVNWVRQRFEKQLIDLIPYSAKDAFKHVRDGGDTTSWDGNRQRLIDTLHLQVILPRIQREITSAIHSVEALARGALLDLDRLSVREAESGRQVYSLAEGLREKRGQLVDEIMEYGQMLIASEFLEAERLAILDELILVSIGRSSKKSVDQLVASTYCRETVKRFFTETLQPRLSSFLAERAQAEAETVKITASNWADIVVGTWTTATAEPTTTAIVAGSTETGDEGTSSQKDKRAIGSVLPGLAAGLGTLALGAPPVVAVFAGLVVVAAVGRFQEPLKKLLSGYSGHSDDTIREFDRRATDLRQEVSTEFAREGREHVEAAVRKALEEIAQAVIKSGVGGVARSDFDRTLERLQKETRSAEQLIERLYDQASDYVTVPQLTEDERSFEFDRDKSPEGTRLLERVLSTAKGYLRLVDPNFGPEDFDLLTRVPDNVSVHILTSAIEVHVGYQDAFLRALRETREIRRGRIMVTSVIARENDFEQSVTLGSFVFSKRWCYRIEGGIGSLRGYSPARFELCHDPIQTERQEFSRWLEADPDVLGDGIELVRREHL